jgi:uncharacterized protein (DUF885 family)
MISQISFYLLTVTAIFVFSFKPQIQDRNDDPDIAFTNFENRFLDAYWKQHPSSSIGVGYGKYYDELIIPGRLSVANDIAFSKAWLDSLNKMDLTGLSDNNKISVNIIKNQLESDIWYASVFKPQEWDASYYNISGECDYIVNQPFASLDERLLILSTHIEHADEYFKAAFQMLKKPTKEHVQMAIQQNEGGLSVFGSALTDSIKASHLSEAEKLHLQENIAKSIQAINAYVGKLKGLVADKNYAFRNFRIGKDLYREKFKYDLAIDNTPEQIYQKALTDLGIYQQKMTKIANGLWQKYYGDQARPKDDLQTIQMLIDKIQLQHASPKDFFDTLTNQVYRLKQFISEKGLFALDTSETPIKVRLMPEYARVLPLQAPNLRRLIRNRVSAITISMI